MNCIERIERIFRQHSKEFHFYLRDIKSGREFVLGRERKYPIGSCFKLAVLMAYFDSLSEPKELDRIVTLDPERFSPGGGVLNYFTRPVSLSCFQLAQLMISISDGTATDWFIDQVGLDAVNKCLKTFGPNSNISKNLREMVARYNARYLELLSSGVSKENANQITAKEQCLETDYSNGRDLANLALGTHSFQTRPNLQRAFLEIFKNRRFFLRTSSYLPENVRFLGKSGSLGFGHYMNDCGAIEIDGELVGSFGYTSEGWTHAKDVGEAILGVAGVEIARYFDPSVLPNQSFRKSTERLALNA